MDEGRCRAAGLIVRGRRREDWHLSILYRRAAFDVSG